jgi:DNA polymerase-3 subunit epsilon
MQLNLKKPLAFFDLETTGLNMVHDRIFEISIVKILVDNSQLIKTIRVNPQVKISEEASKITGVKDEDLKDCPTFKEVAHQIVDFIRGCDLAGYNCNKFDVPFLAEEFARNDVDFDLKKAKVIDVQGIFHKMEQRTLSAAYKFYCDKELENAHSAEADTIATYEVFKAQIERYEDTEFKDRDGNISKPIVNDMEQLAKFTGDGKGAVDFAGRIVYNEKGVEVFNFGKYKGMAVEEVLKTNPGYYGWMLQGDFPNYTKKVLTQIKLKSML